MVRNLILILDEKKVAKDSKTYTFTAEQVDENKTVMHQLMVREEYSRRQKNFRSLNLTRNFSLSQKWTIQILPAEGPQTCYLDEDGDAYGDPGKSVQSDSPPANCMDNSTACDDSEADINPGISEIPSNGKDDDCNPATPDGQVVVDEDQDGYPQESDCDDNDPDINPGMQEVPYNGKNDDCSEATRDDDLDGDTFAQANDCNDTDPAVNPSAQEVCNNKDDNCDGAIDEGDICLSADALAQDGLNQLISRMQTYMINGETPTSVEDILPYAVVEDIRSNYFEAALGLESNNPSAHLGLAVLDLLQIAYDLDSVAIIDFMVNMMSGASGESEGGTINLDINQSGLFAGAITDLHQYLPYHYWFTFKESTAYPANMLNITKNIIKTVMGNLFDLRLPIPLKDDYSASELTGLTFFGLANNLTAGLVGYSSIDITQLLSPQMTIVFPDLTFDGMIQGLTQAEIDALVMSFSSTIFNAEE